MYLSDGIHGPRVQETRVERVRLQRQIECSVQCVAAAEDVGERLPIETSLTSIALVPTAGSVILMPNLSERSAYSPRGHRGQRSRLKAQGTGWFDRATG